MSRPDNPSKKQRICKAPGEDDDAPNSTKGRAGLGGGSSSHTAASVSNDSSSPIRGCPVAQGIVTCGEGGRPVAPRGAPTVDGKAGSNASSLGGGCPVVHRAKVEGAEGVLEFVSEHARSSFSADPEEETETSKQRPRMATSMVQRFESSNDERINGNGCPFSAEASQQQNPCASISPRPGPVVAMAAALTAAGPDHDSLAADKINRYESEERMKMEAMVDSAVDPIVQIDDKGIIQMVNPACRRVFKYEVGQMVGQNVKMLMPSEHSAKHDKYLTNYLETGIKKVIGTGRKLRGRKSDGRTFSMFLSLSEARIGDKTVFTGIIRDLSAEEEMRNKMEAMINSAVDPIVQIDDRGIIEMVSPACCNVFKYDEGQLVGQNVKILMPKGHATKHDEYLANYMKTGIKKVMGTGRKLEGRKSDGSTFAMFLTLSEARIGDRTTFTGIIRDMSAEENMRQKMAAMIEAAMDPIVQIDDRGIIEKVNPACCRVFQYEEEEMLGQNVKMLMPDCHSIKHDEYLSNYLRTGIKKVMGKGRRLKGRKSDGSTFHMFLSLSEARVDDRVTFTGIIRDISAASEERQKMEAMINSAVDPIVQIDENGFIQMVNPACCRVFKYDEDQLLGQNVKILMPENHASRHDEYLANYLKTGVKKVMGTGRQLRGRKSDGSTFAMFLSLSEAKVGSEKIFTGIIRDLSIRSSHSLSQFGNTYK